MTHDQVIALLRASGTLREGHFRLTSGRHSDRFFLMPHAFQFPEQTEQLCAGLAALFADTPVDTVVGPATGGIILAYEVARQLGRLQGRPVRAVFTEKTDDGGMALKRQWSLAPGERVLMVEDAITTGGSVAKAIEAVKGFAPQIVAVGCIVDRSGGQANFGVPIRALIQVDVQSWLPEECPLCQQGIELVKPKG